MSGIRSCCSGIFGRHQTPCYLRNCWAHSSPFHGLLPFIFSQIRQAWQAGNLSQRKGKAPGPFHKAILLLPPGKAPNLACSRQMDLLSHVRSFTQKHSEAVKRKKKKGERKKKKVGGKGWESVHCWGCCERRKCAARQLDRGMQQIHSCIR